MNNSPALSPIRIARGVAGALSASTTVTYPGEDPSRLEFVGNHFGGPVVMVTPGNPGGVFVSREVTERIGFRFESNPEGWVRHFFG